MSNLIYAHPSDNYSPVTAGGVDWTVQAGTEDPEYPASCLGNGNPGKPAKLSTTTGAWVRDLGTARRIDWIFVVGHNLTAGLTGVKFQGNATNSWGSPTVDQTLTVPAYHEDGFSVGFWLDLTSLGSRTFQYWRLAVTSANGAPVAISEIWLVGTKRELVNNIHWGVDEEDDHDLTEHQTPRGSLSIYDLGIKMRGIYGETETTDAGLDALKAWRRACSGRVKLTAVVFDPALNDAMLVRWSTKQIRWKRNFLDSNLVQLTFEECSRGLPL